MNMFKMTKQLKSSMMILKRTITTEDSSNILFETISNVGIVTLNRVKSLNCINMSMMEQFTEHLLQWEKDKKVKLVITKGAGGKAYCAGGDLKLAVDKEIGPLQFEKMYNLNYLIATYKLPVVSIINGIALGGGMALAVHGKYKIATEATELAMPENKVGSIPDVGASFFLPRLAGYLGHYLALTGLSLKGSDTVAVGLATHFVPASRLVEMERHLTKCTSDTEIQTVLAKFQDTPDKFSMSKNLKNLNHCFAGDTVEEILLRLEKVRNEWAEGAIKAILWNSPTSVKSSLKALQLCKGAPLERCLRLEYRFTSRAPERHDLQHGVHCALRSKGSRPQWDPPTLADVTDEHVEGLLSPPPPGKELQLMQRFPKYEDIV